MTSKIGLEQIREALCKELERTKPISLGMFPAEPGGDLADRANDTMRREEVQAANRLREERRRQLEYADKLAKKGKAGKCEMCGVDIDPARLRVVIGATRCVECQRHLELKMPSLFLAYV